MNDKAADTIDFASLFASIDAMDTDRFLSFIHEDGVFRFGSAPPVTGHSGIRAAVEGFFASIAAVQHEIRRQICDGSTVVCEGEVIYTRHDGSTVTLPFANVFDTAGGLIETYRIYIDIAPLYQK